MKLYSQKGEAYFRLNYKSSAEKYFEMAERISQRLRMPHQ